MKTSVVIEQTQKIKVLGIFITSGFTNIATINNIISKVNYRMLVLREVFKYSVYRTKKILTNSIVMSVIRYASPILISSSNSQLSKLQVMIMKCSRPILGFKSLKYSTQKIMNELSWLPIYQMVTKETILFFHKVVFDNQPPAITKYISFSLSNSQNCRQSRKSLIIQNHKSKKMYQTIFHMANFLLNKLPTDIRLKNTKQLSKYLQYIIGDYFPFDQIMRYEPG